MAADFALARAHWRRIEASPWDPAALGQTTARAAQWTQAKADESAALSRLSQALRDANDAELLKAAAAIKAPFVRGYVSFGWAPGEAPVLPS